MRAAAALLPSLPSLFTLSRTCGAGAGLEAGGGRVGRRLLVVVMLEDGACALVERERE